MALDDLEKNLYQNKEVLGREKGSKKERVKVQDISKQWSEEKLAGEKFSLEEPIVRLSIFSKRFFWVAIVLVVVAIGFLGFYLHQFFASKDVIFNIDAPKEVQIGVPFPVKITFQNTSKSVLKDGKLLIDLPENIVVEGKDIGQKVENMDVGDFEIGASFEKEISFIALGDENTSKRVNVSLSYYPPNIKNRFNKAKAVDIAVKEPAIKLDLSTPTKVLNAEEFEINIGYENISNIDFSNVALEVKYPDNFNFKSSSVSSTQDGAVWQIGNLKKGEKNNLVIAGTISGPEQSFFSIEGTISAEIDGQKYVISQKTSNINIASSPLSLTFSVNKNSSYVASLNDGLNYSLTYKNNTDVPLKDVVLKVTLKGAMFDFSTTNTSGSFDSKNNVITWNASNISDFSSLAPGAGGTVNFSVEAKDSYPIKKSTDKNFVLRAHAEISSPTTPYYVSAEKTLGIVDFDVKVAGLTEIVSKVLFNDSSSGFTNSGWPPRANRATKLTIHWIIKNYSTDVRNVEVKATLAGGVKWLGKVKTNLPAISSSTLPVYNERTQEIVWNIDEILATKGIISKPVEAIFQVEATPNITQVGNFMPLLGVTTIKATDIFNNIDLQNSAAALTTNLTEDPYVANNSGQVQP
ncbi:MAG: hypothetical protein WC297_03020 [Candidatus Paceibacterota bacterium]|jgi:hypothetical protein